MTCRGRPTAGLLRIDRLEPAQVLSGAMAGKPCHSSNEIASGLPDFLEKSQKVWYNLLTREVNKIKAIDILDITFASDKFEKECNSQKLLVRQQGARRAKRIRRRLDDLRAADCLEDMRSLPGRCHELTGDRPGQISLDLDHPYRLIFVPANNPVPCKADGGLDWARVTAIEIIGVEDTHG